MKYDLCYCRKNIVLSFEAAVTQLRFYCRRNLWILKHTPLFTISTLELETKGLFYPRWLPVDRIHFMLHNFNIISFYGSTTFDNVVDLKREKQHLHSDMVEGS